MTEKDSANGNSALLPCPTPVSRFRLGVLNEWKKMISNFCTAYSILDTRAPSFPTRARLSTAPDGICCGEASAEEYVPESARNHFAGILEPAVLLVGNLYRLFFVEYFLYTCHRSSCVRNHALCSEALLLPAFGREGEEFSSWE